MLGDRRPAAGIGGRPNFHRSCLILYRIVEHADCAVFHELGQAHCPIHHAGRRSGNCHSAPGPRPVFSANRPGTGDTCAGTLHRCPRQQTGDAWRQDLRKRSGKVSHHLLGTACNRPSDGGNLATPLICACASIWIARFLETCCWIRGSKTKRKVAPKQATTWTALHRSFLRPRRDL